MKDIETLTRQLAEACREAGLNFVIAIEDGGIRSQFSVKGKSVLRKLTDVLKTIK